eukprot:4578356-Alexandrium_andersonii.AAC.1
MLGAPLEAWGGALARVGVPWLVASLFWKAGCASVLKLDFDEVSGGTPRTATDVQDGLGQDNPA